MKILRNQEGFAIVFAIMILAMITLLGFASIQTSTTEVQITTNMHIHHMEFYAAESGIAVGPLWYIQYHKDNNIDLMTMPSEEAIAWSDGDGGVLGNYCMYDFTVSYRNDGTDVYMEATTLMPDLLVHSEGTHPRGGVVPIEATFTFAPAFTIPSNPIWAEDNVELGGNSTVDAGFNLCDGEAEPKEVKFLDLPDNDFDVDGSASCSGVCEYENSTEVFDMSMVDSLKAEEYTDLPEDAGTYVDDGDNTNDFPKVIRITGDAHVNNSDSFTGHGILIVEGDLIINGGFDWYGLVVVKGRLDAMGTAMVQGAVVVTDSSGVDADIKGRFIINYDCEMINNAFNSFSGYRMTSWIQM